MRAVQREVALAWRVANFINAGGKLKDLDEYLGEMKPKVDPSDQAAAIFEGFAARGLATIKERKKRDDG